MRIGGKVRFCGKMFFFLCFRQENLYLCFWPESFFCGFGGKSHFPSWRENAFCSFGGKIRFCGFVTFSWVTKNDIRFRFIICELYHGYNRHYIISDGSIWFNWLIIKIRPKLIKLIQMSRFDDLYLKSKRTTISSLMDAETNMPIMNQNLFLMTQT